MSLHDHESRAGLRKKLLIPTSYLSEILLLSALNLELD